MSKSLARVQAALTSHGLACEIRSFDESTKTAEQAASAAGCEIDQIVKSIIFQTGKADGIVLFLTAGGNRVDTGLAESIVGSALGRADPDMVRKTTGFAIGGVSPVGHLSPVKAWADPRLLDFPVVWAAAGTPRHIFAISPQDLVRVTGAPVARFTRE